MGGVRWPKSTDLMDWNRPICCRRRLVSGSRRVICFLEDAVSLLDIEEIAVRFKRGRGPRAYHPRMLLSLLLYGYCTGVYSSRKIAAACETDVAFRALCGGQFPDFRTVSLFARTTWKSLRVCLSWGCAGRQVW